MRGRCLARDHYWRPKKSIGLGKGGEVLEIWSGDTNTKNDIPRWCQKVGHEYLGELPGDGYERLFIRRKK
jgi:tRNA 2-thiouridine synthesizing protein A